MRILITGGAGFIGSHLSEALLRLGNTVVIVDDLSTGSFDNIAHLNGNKDFKFVFGSVRDEILMTQLVPMCDVIFHLAAAVGVQMIVDNPVHTIETNIHGTEIVLNIANKFRCKTIIASTSEVYGKNHKIPFNEDDNTTYGSTKISRWSYACSKMVDEFLTLAYYEQYKLPAFVCRFFNTVGPRQTGKYGMVVPRFVKKAICSEPIEIYGTGEQSRCFCNVSDVVSALIKLIQCNEAVGEVINIGMTESVTINELANKIIALTDSQSQKVYLSYKDAYGKPFDDMLVRVPDLNKINRLIGYAPEKSLDETLREIIDYEKKHLSIQNTINK
jgi:UDP-glucose 4-epimerase